MQILPNLEGTLTNLSPVAKGVEDVNWPQCLQNNNTHYETKTKTID